MLGLSDSNTELKRNKENLKSDPNKCLGCIKFYTD